MKRLKEKVYTNGAMFTLYKRGKKACIYMAPGRHFEVFLIRTRPEEKFFGKVYPKREVYPPTRAWSFTAWTFIKLENAMNMFNKLEN